MQNSIIPVHDLSLSASEAMSNIKIVYANGRRQWKYGREGFKPKVLCYL